MDFTEDWVRSCIVNGMSLYMCIIVPLRKELGYNHRSKKFICFVQSILLYQPHLRLPLGYPSGSSRFKQNQGV